MNTLEEYGYNEPIFTDELAREINGIKANTIRQTLKRLVDSNKIKRYKEGIYYIPDPKSKSRYKTLSTNKTYRKIIESNLYEAIITREKYNYNDIITIGRW